MVVFCAYCGKSFTRKEHLERHIPSHTNVKPHRCTNCGLSFARRDLLQRHHSTYHEARDPMDPGRVPVVTGRTPIACQNCANAKTGCDKRVPCSRCAEKNLPCSARFARRSSKAALRAAQASAAHANAAFHTAMAQNAQGLQQPQTINPSFMEIDGDVTKPDPSGHSSPPMLGGTSQCQSPDRNPPKKGSPPQTHVCASGFPSPRVDGLEDFMHINNDYVGPESSYADLLTWPEYPMALDMYSGSLPNLTHFPELSDISAASEPMTAATSSRGSVHTRGTSIMSSNEFENQAKAADLSLAVPNDNSIPEFEVVMAAEGAWRLARCNAPMFRSSCPHTAIVHLECLEQKSKQEGTWSSLETYLEQVDWDASDLASVVPLAPRTRDKMLAITQSFLHKALEIHRGGSNGYAKTGYASPNDFNFIVLPPSKILEYFLRSYVRSLSVYYPLVVAGCVNPNEMLQNTQASTLLVLLMIAQGAAAMPMAEARWLSAGLTETCRISLFDIVEKDVELSADPIALRCALLFIVLGAWSGDKWMMDIAMGQRGMYISMLRNAGMLEPQPSMIPTINSSTSAELQWRAWLLRESQNRMVYNWVMLDQELSLFYDVAPLMSIAELQCPLPGSEVLWMSPNADAWVSAVQSVYGCTANVNPQLLSVPSMTPSLCDVFQDFLHDNLSGRPASFSPQQMRLLLHPIQSLIYHLGQMLSCFPDVLSARRTNPRSVTKASTLGRLEEVQVLLHRWYELTMAYYKANPTCAVTRFNLVMYHIISLSAVTNFGECERLARKEGFEGTYWELSLRHKRCVYQREEAVFHCGQVFRHLHAMPKDRRPTWWSAALYRATLVLWVDSICRLDPSFQLEKRRGDAAGGSTDASASSPTQSAPVAIDRVTPEDPAVAAYVWNGDGEAVLTRADGGSVSIDNPADVLAYGIDQLEDAFSCRMGDGIKRKLVLLGGNWNSESLSMDPPSMSAS